MKFSIDICDSYLSTQNFHSQIQMSLFFDILLAMATNVERNDFVQGVRSGIYGTGDAPNLGKIEKVNFMEGLFILHMGSRKIKGIIEYKISKLSTFFDILKAHTLVPSNLKRTKTKNIFAIIYKSSVEP